MKEEKVWVVRKTQNGRNAGRIEYILPDKETAVKMVEQMWQDIEDTGVELANHDYLYDDHTGFNYDNYSVAVVEAIKKEDGELEYVG